MLNQELEHLLQTAKDIEYRAKAILGEVEEWPPASGATQSTTSLTTRDALAARQG
jgi:hypothetical protein